MTTPSFQSVAPDLLPDYRWLNWTRILYSGVAVAVLLVMAIMVWVSGQPAGLALLMTLVSLGGAAYLLFWTLFRWMLMRIAARRAADERNAEVLLLFSRLESRQAKATTLVRRAGWTIIDDHAVSIWEADSSLTPHSSARMLVEIQFGEIRECRRKIVSAGRAFSRLEILTDDRLLDIAVVPLNGMSAVGVSDGELGQLATRVRSLARSARG